MSLTERQQQFEEAIKGRLGVTKKTSIRRGLGVSNSAKIIEGGLQLGVYNLDRFPSDADQFLILCVLRFPPEDEVFFAVQVKSDVKHLITRLDAMRTLGAAGEGGPSDEDDTDTDKGDPEAEVGSSGSAIQYSARNNLVVTSLASDGHVYLRNKGFWDTLNFDLSVVAPGAKVDSIVAAVYPPSASARRSLLAREFLGYLGHFVGRENVHEVSVWEDERAVSPAMRRMPSDLAVADIRSAIEKLGGHYVDDLVERYHAGLNFHPTKHFVILSGLSGTGKTQLALKYARAVHGIERDADQDPLLFVCPVRPEWTDPTGLTGYYDVLSNRYMVPPFLEAVLVATAQRESPVFVVLDEMNLARVEYYLSDVLSAMETGVPLHLHSSDVPLEGSTGGEIRSETLLPSNLFLTGTVNIDETTNPISDKVLDRAILIDMSAVDLPGFIKKLGDREPLLATSCLQCSPILVGIAELLAPHHLGFGYRLVDEFIRYHKFATDVGARKSDDVIDELLVQKVFVKLRGSEPQRGLLEALRTVVSSRPRSLSAMERLVKDLDDMGSFQNTR